MEGSSEKLYAKYKGLIRSLINSIVVNNISVVDSNDLQQAGALALIVAMRSYDPSLGSFSSYVRKCIRNALIEQANSFNGVFTTDEKVRSQANSIRKLRRDGVSDDDIMARLGIRSRATFISLSNLIDNNSIDLDQVDIPGEIAFKEDSIYQILEDIGLNEQEMEFVNLTIQNYSMNEMIEKMSLSRATLYVIKASIRDKILAWGQNS